MLINSKKLHNLPVETVSGQTVGRVRSFDLDVTGLALSKLYVKSSSYWKQLLSLEQDLIVGKEQIVSVEEDKVVVADLLVKETTTAEPVLINSSEVKTVNTSVVQNQK